MSRSSPAAAPATVMSIPPAEVAICKASPPVPVEDRIKLESVAPAKAIVKSSALPSVVDVILAATPAESIDKPTESIVTRPEALTSKVAPSMVNVPSMSVLSRFATPSTEKSVVTAKSPATVVVDAAPAPMVTSTSPSVACSPSRIKPAVNCELVPLLSATKKDNLPASSVSADSEASAKILANEVCSCAALSPTNSILPMSSPSAAAAPLSLTICKRAPLTSLVVFLMTTSGSLALADANVTVSVFTLSSVPAAISKVPSPEA